MNVNAVGGVELDATVDWLTVDKTITDKNTNTYVFSVGAGASTGVSQKLTFRSKADNSITKVYTVYSIKKELVFNNYTDNSSYSDIDNLSNANPAITYFPCEGSYCEFTVVSPKGVNISASSVWASVTEYSSDKNSVTGVVTSKVRVQRTQSGDYYGDLRQETFTATVSNKYPSQTSKSFSIAQKNVVYPGSGKPANPIDNDSYHFWVAPVDVARAHYNQVSTVSCPSGWRIPSVNDFEHIQGASWSSSNLNVTYSGNSQVLVAFSGVNDYWSSNPGDYALGFYILNSRYGIWTFGVGNPRSIRCIKNK